MRLSIRNVIEHSTAITERLKFVPTAEQKSKISDVSNNIETCLYDLHGDNQQPYLAQYRKGILMPFSRRLGNVRP